jgi:predicted glycosyltransferase
MKILIDLGHPAHLHFFRNVASRLADEGHTVIFTGRDKDILVELANKYQIDLDVFGVARPGALNLGRELIYRQWQLVKRIRRIKPDLMMGIAGTFISIPGKILGVPTYIFYDTEHATISNLLAYPFATCTYVPRCYRKKIRWRHERYNGYHELAYLHPKYFQPDPQILLETDLSEGEPFSIVRFVSWGAGHDIGRSGFTPENKLRAIHELAKHGRVLISCEGDLPADLEEYRLTVDISKAHHLMAFASLIFGESATMCSEGAVLGVPGVYVDPVGRGYTDEQERDYGLVYQFTSEQQNDAVTKGLEIIQERRADHWRAQGARLRDEKIDVAEMIHDVAMNRPFA